MIDISYQKRRTDRQRHKSAYRVAPQLKIVIQLSLCLFLKSEDWRKTCYLNESTVVWSTKGGFSTYWTDVSIKGHFVVTHCFFVTLAIVLVFVIHTIICFLSLRLLPKCLIVFRQFSPSGISEF